MSTSAVAVSEVTPNESGLATALLNVGRYLGGSLGIAVMGPIAATVTRNQLPAGPPTHTILNRATTAGFNAGFEVAGLIALVGLVTAVAAVRHRPAQGADTVPAEAA